jgi:Flp pilus assembly protein TadG
VTGSIAIRQVFAALRRPLRSQQASQIVEFAVTLPLLLMFIVGIYDFGGAFNLKQKLNVAMRAGARIGSADPSTELTVPATSLPPSLNDVRNVVASYLQNAQINDCGLLGITGPGVVQLAPLTWQYSANGNNCPGTMTLTVERGRVVNATVNGVSTFIPCTRVSVSYPYQWRFGRIIQLVVPSANYALLTQITTDAIMQNTN